MKKLLYSNILILFIFLLCSTSKFCYADSMDCFHNGRKYKNGSLVRDHVCYNGKWEKIPASQNNGKYTGNCFHNGRKYKNGSLVRDHVCYNGKWEKIPATQNNGKYTGKIIPKESSVIKNKSIDSKWKSNDNKNKNKEKNHEKNF